MNTTPLRAWRFSRYLVVVLLLGGIAGAVYLAPSSPPPEEKQATVLPVRVVQVRPTTSFSEPRIFTGTLKARRTSELTFHRTDRLVQMLVDEGDQVMKGDLLARLEVRSLLARKDELLAQRMQAKAVLDELIAGPRKESIAVAQAEVQALEAHVSLAQQQYARENRLIGSSATSQEAYHNALAELESAKAKLSVARNRLQELKAGTREEKIEAQKAAVACVDARLASLNVELQDSELLAPFSGRVARRYVDEGAIVSPQEPILRLVEDQRLEAHIGIPPRLTLGIKPQAEVTLQVQGRSVQARVRAVLPELSENTRTRTVILDLPSSPDPCFSPGQIVRLALDDYQDIDQGYWLPTSALTRGVRGLWSAYKVVRDEETKEQIIKPVDLQVLHVQSNRSLHGDECLVTGTLQPGDLVLVDGVHRVVPRQRVRPVLINQR